MKYALFHSEVVRNGRHFTDNIVNNSYFEKYVAISIEIWQNFTVYSQGSNRQ